MFMFGLRCQETVIENLATHSHTRKARRPFLMISRASSKRGCHGHGKRGRRRRCRRRYSAADY